MRRMLLGLVAACGLLAGCAGVASPVYGWYTDVEWSTQLPNGPAGPKSGESKCTSILGLIAQGDASVSAAARAGGITKVMTVEHHSKNILGLFAEFTTKVTGE